MSEVTRLTQAGFQILGSGDPAIRVTQIGANILARIITPPYTPSILSVEDITANTATVTSSTFSDPLGASHAGTRYQVQRSGGSWTGIVFDSGMLEAVTEAQLSGLSSTTFYDVRVSYLNDEGGWSDWSAGYRFNTTYISGQADPFSWDDYAQLGNIEESHYGYGTVFAPGSWYVMPSTAWNAVVVDDCREGTPPGTQVACERDYYGRIGAWGRLFGPPAAVGNTAHPNRGSDVSAQVHWWSAEAGSLWSRYYDCEFASAGVAALVCGTATANDNQAAWNVWYNSGVWTYSDEYQGVYAFISPGLAWPWNRCCPGKLLSTPAYGDAGASLNVHVWFGGTRVKQYSIALPWNVVFSSYHCPQCIAPWYGIRLKVWRDLTADPTGKTHRIQATASAPDGTLATGFGDGEIPNDGTWLIDETWTGGYDETNPGDGDGGLLCGYSGPCTSRPTGAVSNWYWGVNFFRSISIVPLESGDCLPCGELPPPETLNDTEPPEYPPIPLAIGGATCPPEAEGDFQNLFLGGKDSGAVYQFGGYEIDSDHQIIARIRPNPISPMGPGGEALFTEIYVAVEHIGDIAITTVPIVNGERLDRYKDEQVLIGPGDRIKLYRYEIPLHRSYEDPVVGGEDNERFKYGLTGTFFTFEMTIVDICGLGLTMPGVEVAWMPKRDALEQGVVYTEDLLVAPVFVPTGQTYMGVKGANRLLKGGTGTTDDGEDVNFRAYSNPVCPQGVGGECAFKRFDLLVTRWNENPMTIEVTPIVDNEELPTVSVEYQGTTAPVTEVTPVKIVKFHTRDDGTERMRYNPRGAWFWVKVEGEELQEWLTLEGGSLDYEIVRESLQEDSR